MRPLPIDPHLLAIVAALQSARALVLSAPPGAGKTTRVPRALYDAGFAAKGEILVLEPRRLAARLAAARMAEELGERVGETVGYSIRFENVSGPRTRIRFLTEAILARRMVRDPDLAGVSVVILDEFHERHLATDLALAFMKRAANRDLRIVVMSATLDAAPVASFLSGAEIVSVPGSPFDVEIEYEEKAVGRPLSDKVAAAVAKLARSGLNGDILVFLPGYGEIRRCAEALQPRAERLGMVLIPLHGDLPAAEQQRAINPSDKRKVILATNVAETSITIPGIGAVIDSGLARVAGHSPWSGLPVLTTMKISKSSALQRAGRAGRTQAGRAIRLYTRADYESRPDHETPEIRRADLAETCLMLHGAGVRRADAFPWFEAPPQAAVEAAETLLVRLGAIDREGGVTPAGFQMLELPVHPRLGRLILEGKTMKLADESALLAALLSERDIRLNARTRFERPGAAGGRAEASGPSDLLELLDRFHEAAAAGFASERLLSFGLDPGAVQAVRRAHRQLKRVLTADAPSGSPEAEVADQLLIATLAAFPDRVAKRKKEGSRELLLAGGGTAVLSPASVVHSPMFVVAVDAEERRERTPQSGTGTIIRLASGIEIEWLAALFPDAISEKTELIWNERAGRVDETRSTHYGQITLEERAMPAPRTAETAQILMSAAFARGLSPFRDASSLASFRARVSLLARCFPHEEFPEIDDAEIRRTVELLCRGKRSLDELSGESLIEGFMSRFSERQRARLGRDAPERIPLGPRRTVKVHYEQGRPPWIESRLQDFFGMKTAPAVCAGQVPLTVHLLAPNGRAVQVTSDLAGFWQRHYPSIRKELQRRYPKHAWPSIDVSR